MRKSEITPELIELSKRAKELGFPQDVERGDWVCDVTDDELYLIETLKEEGDALILSFSRCLEWLRGKDGIDGISVDEDKLNKRSICEMEFRDVYDGCQTEAKTHHEAIAKAVVKILEEKNDVTPTT